MPSKKRIVIGSLEELLLIMTMKPVILCISIITIDYAISNHELSQLVKFVTSIEGLEIGIFILEDYSKVTNFGLLGQLKKAKIKELVLSKTTRMTSISWLCRLQSLCKLMIDDCSRVTDFGPLVGLVNLQYLDLGKVPKKSIFPKL